MVMRSHLPMVRAFVVLVKPLNYLYCLLFLGPTQHYMCLLLQFGRYCAQANLECFRRAWRRLHPRPVLVRLDPWGETNPPPPAGSSSSQASVLPNLPSLEPASNVAPTATEPDGRSHLEPGSSLMNDRPSSVSDTQCLF